MRDKAPDSLVISYAPSNTNARGWNDKSYHIVNRVLKRMRYEGMIDYQLIHNKPFDEVMRLKREALLGVDEVSTGSYHLSTLEYLSLGVPCIVGTDALTDKVVRDLTGCQELPFIKANKDNFETVVRNLIRDRDHLNELSRSSRDWMECFWSPEKLCLVYKNMYDKL